MNTEVKSTISIIMCIIIATPGCYHPTKIKSRKVFITHDRLQALRNKNNTEQSQQIPTITIWVHGTRLLPSPIFRSYVYCACGLHLANELPPSYFLRQLSDAIINADPSRFNHEDFYLFGWTGKLDAAIREQAAKDLCQDLKKLIAEYHLKYQCRPFIRLITHSHGGNVALNLARFKNPENDLFIDELILLACPVQDSTKPYLKDAMFGRVYAMYSSIDLLQILAPQFYWPIQTNSNHKKPSFKFPPTSSRLFPIQSNMIQVKIKKNKHAILHTEFSSARFTQYLPILLDELNAWNTEDPQWRDAPNTKRLLKFYTN